MIRVTGRAVRIPAGGLGLLFTLWLAGCAASGPLELPHGQESMEPREVTADHLPLEEEQVWGGVIANVDNREQVSVIEVVGYPLRQQEPQTHQSSTGRFRLQVPGLADPTDYRPGRRITAVGMVTRVEEGQIGQADYLFPILDAGSTYLWPPLDAVRDPGRVRFGIGIGIGL